MTLTDTRPALPACELAEPLTAERRAALYAWAATLATSIDAGPCEACGDEEVTDHCAHCGTTYCVYEQCQLEHFDHCANERALHTEGRVA